MHPSAMYDNKLIMDRSDQLASLWARPAIFAGDCRSSHRPSRPPLDDSVPRHCAANHRSYVMDRVD